MYTRTWNHFFFLAFFFCCGDCGCGCGGIKSFDEHASDDISIHWLSCTPFCSLRRDICVFSLVVAVVVFREVLDGLMCLWLHANDTVTHWCFCSVWHNWGWHSEMVCRHFEDQHHASFWHDKITRSRQDRLHDNRLRRIHKVPALFQS